MQDSNGRWFSFCIDHQTVMILEKKGLPSHLGSLPCVDSPTYLSAIIRELEDAGEVGTTKINQTNAFNITRHIPDLLQM